MAYNNHEKTQQNEILANHQSKHDHNCIQHYHLDDDLWHSNRIVIDFSYYFLQPLPSVEGVFAIVCTLLYSEKPQYGLFFDPLKTFVPVRCTLFNTVVLH